MKRALVWINSVVLVVTGVILLFSINYHRRATVFVAKIDSILVITRFLQTNPTSDETEAFFASLELPGFENRYVEEIDHSRIEFTFRVSMRRYFPIGPAEFLTYSVDFSGLEAPRLEYRSNISPW